MSVRSTIIAAMHTDLLTLKTDTATYSAGIKRVIDHNENIEVALKAETPLLMVFDTGNEEVRVRDGTYTRYGFDVEIWGFVRNKSWTATLASLSTIAADIKEWVQGGPSIGAAVLEIHYVATDTHQYDEKSLRGQMKCTIHIQYYVTDGTY